MTDNSSGHASAMNHWLSRGAAAIAVVTGLAMIATPANARWYKWVDEDGNISYQDRPPPSSFEESTQVLSDSGVTLKTIPSKQEQIELDRRAEIERKKQQRDEALLKAFPHESDLITTRDKRVIHIDGAISRMHDQLVILKNESSASLKKVARSNQTALRFCAVSTAPTH